MTYTEALEYTSSLSRFGWILGLDRLAVLLDRLNNPQKGLKFVHLAGTNGKGSTSAFCANILKAAGYKTGLFISPFILDFCERIQINGEMIPRDEYARIVSRIAPVTDGLISQGIVITEFEFICAIAFCYYAQEDCDYVCLETGLGGRFDATNVIDAPRIAVITSISYDHTDILGDNLEKIAGEKAAIIKEGCLAVSYPNQTPEAAAVIMEQCAHLGVVLHSPSLSTLEIISASAHGTEFSYAGKNFNIKLAGKHQVCNAITAITVAGLLEIPDEAISVGLSATTFPARFELFGDAPTVILDGAHNFDAMSNLALSLKTFNIAPDVLVLGMLADKDYARSAELIVPLCKTVITTSVPSHRGLDPHELARNISHPDIRVQEDPRQAVETALRLADKGCVLVTGSLYLVSKIRKEIQNDFH